MRTEDKFIIIILSSSCLMLLYMISVIYTHQDELRSPFILISIQMLLIGGAVWAIYYRIRKSKNK